MTICTTLNDTRYIYVRIKNTKNSDSDQIPISYEVEDQSLNSVNIVEDSPKIGWERCR